MFIILKLSKLFEIILMYTNSIELELFTTLKLFYETTKLSHKNVGYFYLKSNLEINIIYKRHQTAV